MKTVEDSSNTKNQGEDAQRDALRGRLLAARENLAERGQREKVLVNRLARWLKTMPVSRLGFYWPIKHEPDVREVIIDWLTQDSARTASLPVVNEEETLDFVAWSPNSAMVKGRFGIPVPDRAARVSPQVWLIPCLGIDARRYRLGYGGGYYDRSLAKIKVKPVTVGVAFDCGRVPSIYPQSHDVRLDLVITESGVL